MDEWLVAQARVALLRGKRLDLVERVKAYRVLAEVEPQVYLPKLAQALSSLIYTRELDDSPEAGIALTEETIEAARRIPDGHPERPTILARALDAGHWRLSKAGRHEDAFALRAEMAAISEAAGDPGPHSWAVALAEEGRYAEAASVYAELAGAGERKMGGGYQATFWSVLLSVSGRADERFPPTGPRPPLDISFHHWSPHVRSWWGEQERAPLRDEIEALRPRADAEPERHLRELVTLHRRLLVRTAVHFEFRSHLFLEPLRTIFDEGVMLARRLRPFDDGIALRTALLDRSTLLLAGKEYEGGYKDFLEALALMR